MFDSLLFQLVASADCAGALDITDDLQNLLVCFVCDFDVLGWFS